MIQIDWLTPGVPTPIRLYYEMLNAEPPKRYVLQAQFHHIMKRCRPIVLDDFPKIHLDVFHHN